MNPHLAHALGISSKPTGLPAPKPAAKTEPAKAWRVRGVLEVEVEVFARDAAEAAVEARTALEDVGARVDAMPNCWAGHGELSEPEMPR